MSKDSDVINVLNQQALIGEVDASLLIHLKSTDVDQLSLDAINHILNLSSSFLKSLKHDVLSNLLSSRVRKQNELAVFWLNASKSVLMPSVPKLQDLVRVKEAFPEDIDHCRHLTTSLRRKVSGRHQYLQQLIEKLSS